MVRFIFWKAYFGLLAFDLLGFGRDFVKLRRKVSKWPVADKPVPEGLLDRVCTGVDRACSWYPKRAMCLQRSAVTTCLLRSCGVPAQMVLGAQKLPFRAHAWVEVKGHVVNERTDVQKIYGTWERC